MAYRSQPQYRSWNALALGLKTEEPEGKDRQRPRRESWSQPPLRGRGTRGRGTWYIDNRPQAQRRYTMPNSRDEFQDRNYNCRATNDSSSNHKIENLWDDNPILEEPQNLSTSSDSDHNDFKMKENDKDNQNHEDEAPSWNRKYHEEKNIYRPPKSRSTSYGHWRSSSSSDDGSQSLDYSSSHSSGSKTSYKVQTSSSWERGYINNDSNQTWVHDKYEDDSGSDTRDKKDASTQVSPPDPNNESFKKVNPGEVAVSTCKKINKSSEYPKEITIKFSELTLKDSPSNDEKSESAISQTLVKDEAIIASEMDKVTSEVISETNHNVTPEVPLTPVTPKEEELPLINLDDDEKINLQQIQPKISQDVLGLDWGSYQKSLIEEELRRNKIERQNKTLNPPHKLDTGLKDFDSLL